MFFRSPEAPFTQGSSWPSQYYRRASFLQIEARRILIFIVGLLFVGAAAFIFAASITRFDIGSAPQTLTERITQTQNANNTMQQKINELSQQAVKDDNSFIDRIIRVIDAYKTANPRFFSDQQPNPPTTIGLGVNKYSGKAFGEQLRNAIAGNPKVDPFVLSLQSGGSLPPKTFVVTREGATKLADEIGAGVAQDDQLQSDRDARAKAMERLTLQSQHGGQLLERLKSRQLDEEANSDKSKDTVADVSTQSLILTSITRFGSLAIVLFLVAILIPLYRYNLRLAAFYISIGDALAMTKLEDDKGNSLETLVKLLTPAYDFGRSPKTPVDQAIELVRAARAAKSE